ncbi:SRPBCC family protein [Actinomadura sp. 6K520]|uniref:SRPBCC family protein n=1 Tax=Actinomadura sp. 6K520 TaxID=2530364 RepID=UPI0010447452|nr:SRPBCC family protein [Actinomadura sp. 6K520]TDE19579.1 SRPBCC family protein [Actinomadura sp. 6K520]
MTPTPTGRLIAVATGTDLEMTREFKAPIEDVWASITEPDRTARWFAHWTGEGRPGAKVRLKLVLEEGQPESDMTIIACEPPRRLEVETVDEYGRWHLEARLAEAGGVTTLTFLHHLEPDTDAATTGPGWEYYLDRLVASMTGAPAPSFDDYYPAQAEYYKGLSAN